MRVLHLVPGLGHWILGQKRKGLLLSLPFLLLIGIAFWRSRMILEILSHTYRKMTGQTNLFTSRHTDFLVATIFLTLMILSLMVYSWISCTRLLRSAGKPKEESQSQWAIVWRQFKRNRLAVIGALLILFVYFVALLAPFLAPFDPDDQGHRVKERLLRPSADHPLGTDKFARDFFSRIIFGSRISLLIGFLAVGIAVSIGTVYGAVAGYYGRKIDALMMRFVDMMLSFPTLILIITIIAIWRNQSIFLIICIIGVTSWMAVARLIRGEFLVLKELEFFHAARALGAGTSRLIFRHLLPNALTPIIIASTLRVGSTILLEASLSYLGLGVQPPTPSWGNMVMDAKGNIFSEWWLPLSAGTAVVITVVGYNLLGDGLRDSLDPRLRQ